MVTPLIRSRSFGGKWNGLVTRDCPNVIVPTLTSSVSHTMGTGFVYPASYTQITASLAYDFLLRQAIITSMVGAGLSANGSLYLASLMQYLVATGASDSEVDKASGIDALNAYVEMLGRVDDAVSASLVIATVLDIPLGYIEIPASTRIGWKGAIDGTPTIKAQRIYLSGYDLSTFAFTKYAPYTLDYEQGNVAQYPSPLVSLGSTSITSGAGVFSQGAYGVVSASLSDDYLIRTVAIRPDGASNHAQFDISLGADTEEVVQARAALPMSSTYRSAGLIRFPYPFIAYAGERLTVRAACTRASSVFLVQVYGEQLT